MKNNTLIFLDWVSGFFISPLIILAKLFQRYLSKKKKLNRNGQLIIKFLGAGNYVAMARVITDQTTLISAESNRAAIEYFLKPKEVFYIDDSRMIQLIKTTFGAIIFASKGAFNEAINLETESIFAKLLVTLSGSNLIMGLSNIHKSYLDAYIYDRYLVNPSMISKEQSISLLSNFRLILDSNLASSILNSQSEFYRNVKFKSPIRRVAFCPSGSDTDIARRISVDIWGVIASKLVKQIPGVKIDVYFQSKNDLQYQDMVDLLAGYVDIQFYVGSYENFVKGLAKQDLIVCIDSQSLHIANYYAIPVICFYGPTTPYAVSFSSTTYPISLSASCSPCVHKYFIKPCGNNPVCMNFLDDDLDIFDKLVSLYS